MKGWKDFHTSSNTENNYMLHLDRRVNETILLIHNETGEEITLVILDVRGKNITLGFEDNNKSHTILRKEVKQRQENHDNPNPFYKDRVPHWYKKNKAKKEDKDGLAELVDQLIPTENAA